MVTDPIMAFGNIGILRLCWLKLVSVKGDPDVTEPKRQNGRGSMQTEGKVQGEEKTTSLI